MKELNISFLSDGKPQAIVKVSMYKISTIKQSGVKTLEWDILNPNRLINLEINNKRRISIT